MFDICESERKGNERKGSNVRRMITTGGGGVFFIYMVLHTVPEGISEIIM